MTNPPQSERPEGDDGSRSVTGDLAARIARARGERTPVRQPASPGGQPANGASRAYRLASEFVAAIIVGAGLGFGIDALFHTRPWAMVVLLLLGFAAGVVNVVRASAEMNAAAAVSPNTPAAPDSGDD